MLYNSTTTKYVLLRNITKIDLQINILSNFGIFTLSFSLRVIGQSVIEKSNIVKTFFISQLLL